MEREYFDQSDRLNERKVTLKRKYTENYPAITVGKSARIRNKMLEAIADGKITQDQFNAMLSELSADSKRWMKRNAKFFSISEDGVTLTKSGSRILKQIKTEKPTMRKLVMESFNDFVSNDDVNENVEMINERYVKSIGYKTAAERIEDLARQLDPNSRLCKGISKGADNVVPEFKEMKKHMDEIYTIWQEIEYTIEMSNESVVTESEAVNILNDLLDERGGDMGELHGMSIEDAQDTVEAYGHKGSKAKKIAQELHSLCNESVVTEEVLCEATVEMDAMDPDNKDFLKFLKKNRVKIISKEMQGPNGMQMPVITMQGKRKDLENVLADGEYGWDDADLAEYIEESVVNEGLHPELKKAQQAIKKGKTVYGENVRFPGRFKILELGNMFAKVDYEDGTKPYEIASMNIRIDSLQIESVTTDSNEAINEAFKSSKLRNLMNMDHAHTSYGKKIHGLAQAFYSLTNAKLDQIGDEQLIDFADPKQAAKESRKNKDTVVFYISDNHKENPYAPRSSYNDVIRPGIIGVSRGNDFLGAHYSGSGKRLGKNKAKAEYHMSPSQEGAIGGNKKYGGYEASGLATIKRVVEVADRAIVINLALIKDTELDARQKVADRTAAKEGAIAFKSAKDFKDANRKRYQEILATKASKLPLDKMVEGAIETLTKHIADAMKSGVRTKYNEIKIGEDKRGREIKLTDASNIMSSILGDYERYVRYVADAEKEKDSGYSSGYYEKEAKEYAKRVSDRVKKVKNMDYAW